MDDDDELNSPRSNKITRDEYEEQAGDRQETLDDEEAVEEEGEEEEEEQSPEDDLAGVEAFLGLSPWKGNNRVGSTGRVSVESERTDRDSGIEVGKPHRASAIPLRQPIGGGNSGSGNVLPPETTKRGRTTDILGETF